MSEQADKAKQLLRNYFKVIGQRTGMVWEHDYNLEIDQAVDLIIEAAVDAARAERERGTNG